MIGIVKFYYGTLGGNVRKMFLSQIPHGAVVVSAGDGDDVVTVGADDGGIDAAIERLFVAPGLKRAESLAVDGMGLVELPVRLLQLIDRAIASGIDVYLCNYAEPSDGDIKARSRLMAMTGGTLPSDVRVEYLPL